MTNMILINYFLMKNKKSGFGDKKNYSNFRMKFDDFGLKVLWGRINVRTWRPQVSKPGPKVLLAHGFSDSAGCFTEVVKRLPSDWNIAGLDFPGHGDSNLPDSIFTPRDLYLHSISHVIDHLGWEQFHLVGHSMGGNISSAYNILFPEQLHSLTLLDVPGIWCMRPELQPLALKMSILIDKDRMDMYYKPGRPRTWEEWRILIKNAKNQQAEEENFDPWFPTDEVADEWLRHTLSKGSKTFKTRVHSFVNKTFENVIEPEI